MRSFRFFWFIGVVIAVSAAALYFTPEPRPIKFLEKYCIEEKVYVQYPDEQYLTYTGKRCKPLKEKPR